MRRTYKVLNAIFIASLCISAAMVLLFETDILPDGICHTATGASEFVWATVMELLTICIIPVALRLFRFRHIAERLVSAEALLNWGALRLLMLCVPMVLNTFIVLYVYERCVWLHGHNSVPMPLLYHADTGKMRVGSGEARC